MKIRTARLSDADAIANIHYSAWKTVYKGLIPDDYLNSLSSEEFNQRWQKHLNDPIYRALVFEDSQKVLGFVYFGPCDDAELKGIKTAEIICIYFDSNARGKGYGELIYREAEKIIKAENYECICIKLLATNLPACRFYEKLGLHLDKVYDNHTKLKNISLREKRYLIQL